MTDAEHPRRGADARGEARIRRALKWSAAVLGLIAAGVVASLLLREERPAEQPAAEHLPVGPSVPTTTIAAPVIPYTDVTDEAGVDFVHQTGGYGERLLPEAMGGGVAFFDYDNDGDQDLLLVNSDHWPWRPRAGDAPTSRLYRNRGDGTFDDVSVATGMAVRAYGMGVAAGDYDGDGFTDVLFTAVGGNRLLRNDAGKRFLDETATAGVAGGEDAWSTSAAFFDYDGDGDLDLFVCDYVAWSADIDRAVDFRLTGIGRAFGPPTDFAGTDSTLYRNDGGTFTDVTAEAGVEVANAATGTPVGKALAVLPVDVNGDGWLDLVVANDTVRNFLFLNQGDGRFVESGIDAGLAFDTTGSATGAMGIDAAYYDNDDKLAIAIGNFANEMSSFYVARPGESVFSDDAIVTGVGPPSRRALTFGLVFLDADLDGRLDMLAANGHVEPAISRVQASQSYAQNAQLFWHCGADCRRRYLLADGGDLANPLVGRGAAYADIDGDGDLDVALTQTGGRAVLLRNDQAFGHRWARFALRGQPPNRHAIGATVTLSAGGATQTRTVMPARSYLSQVELPVTFGLGDTQRIDSVAVRWPNGDTERWYDLATSRLHTLEAGTGSR